MSFKLTANGQDKFMLNPFYLGGGVLYFLLQLFESGLIEIVELPGLPNILHFHHLQVIHIIIAGDSKRPKEGSRTKS